MAKHDAISPLPVLLVALLLFFGFAGYLHWVLLPQLRDQETATQDVADRLDRLESSVALLHFMRDPEGRPTEAILDHIAFWSEREERYGSSVADKPVVDQWLRLGVEALEALGEDAYDAVERAFFEAASEPERSVFRRRLLRVLAKLDPERAAELFDNLVRTPGQPSGIRSLAAHLLVGLDADRAGQAIRRVILNETYRGPRHQVQIAGTQQTVPSGLKQQSFPGFFELIDTYLRTNDPKKVDVLLSVLNTEGHDDATYSAVVTGLQEKKDPAAVADLKRHFESGRHSPLVRRKMADAVATIAGRSACAWLKEQYTRETDRIVSTTLEQLLRSYCG